jgi:hypothetical protein
VRDLDLLANICNFVRISNVDAVLIFESEGWGAFVRVEDTV